MLRSIDQEKCVGCGACFKACPFDVYRMDTDQPKAAPCTAGCPAHVDMRVYINYLQMGMHAEAAYTLFSRNPLSGFTCSVCPHFCEKVCTRQKIDSAVNVPALEDYLFNWALEHRLPLPPVRRADPAIVAGAGAAGLAAAWFMRMYGFRVIVYEKDSEAGGQFRGKVDKERVKSQIKLMSLYDISFRLNTSLGDGLQVSPDNLLEEGGSSLIIATGKGTASEFASLVDLENDNIKTDSVTRQTRTNGVFAAGDVNGSSHDPAHEIGDAFEAAWSAKCFADGWDQHEGRPPRKREIFTMPIDKLFPFDPKYPIGNLPPMPRNDCRQGAVYKYPEAMAEVQRCVTCGSRAIAQYKNDCMTCYFCEMACPVDAIRVDPIKEKLPRTITFEREGI